MGISGLASSAAGHCSSYGGADSYDARGARQRSGGVEKYSSIASRQAPEHGSAASSLGPTSRIADAFYHSETRLRCSSRSNNSISGCSFEQVCIALRTGDCDDDVKR